MPGTFHRSGYTALELIMVFAIIAVLATLSAPAILGTMRQAAFSKASTDIMTVHVEAQNMARRFPEAGNNYGVRLTANDNGLISAVVIHGHSPLEDTRRNLSPAVMLFRNGTPQSSAGTVAEWWYQPGSGLLTDHYALNRAGVMLGLPTPAPEFQTADESPITHIAQQLGNDPGLELATRRADRRVAIRIYPVGVMTMAAVKEEN